MFYIFWCCRCMLFVISFFYQNCSFLSTHIAMAATRQKTKYLKAITCLYWQILFGCIYWRCKCGELCQVMGRSDECVCCQEIAATRDMCVSLCNEGPQYANEPPPNCITQHPGFAAVCLNKWVLRTAWHQYKQQYQESYEGPEHKQFRHIAYRQLARWCWGYLGKEVRVVLPSCAVPVCSSYS